MKSIPKKLLFINTSLLCFVLLLICSCGEDSGEIIGPSEPEIGEFTDDITYRVYPNLSDNFATAEFRIWVPETSEPLRAVVVLTHSYNLNALGFAYSEYWQLFAKKENVALLAVYLQDIPGSTLTYTSANEGTGKALLVGLEQLAEHIEKPYIKDLPLLMRGYSAGGVFSYSFSDFKPERLLAFANIRGGSLGITSEKNIRVPGLMFMGELDNAQRNNRIIGAMSAKRSDGANWSLILEQGTDHFGGLEKADDMIQFFFTKVLDRRLSSTGNQLIEIKESEGWLGNNVKLETYKFNEYPYQIKDASWLIDEEFAEKWLDFQAN